MTCTAVESVEVITGVANLLGVGGGIAAVALLGTITSLTDLAASVGDRVAVEGGIGWQTVPRGRRKKGSFAVDDEVVGPTLYREAEPLGGGDGRSIAGWFNKGCLLKDKNGFIDTDSIELGAGYLLVAEAAATVVLVAAVPEASSVDAAPSGRAEEPLRGVAGFTDFPVVRRWITLVPGGAQIASFSVVATLVGDRVTALRGRGFLADIAAEGFDTFLELKITGPLGALGGGRAANAGHTPHVLLAHQQRRTAGCLDASGTVVGSQLSLAGRRQSSHPSASSPSAGYWQRVWEKEHGPVVTAYENN